MCGGRLSGGALMCNQIRQKKKGKLFHDSEEMFDSSVPDIPIARDACVGMCWFFVMPIAVNNRPFGHHNLHVFAQRRDMSANKGEKNPGPQWDRQIW